MAEKKPKVIDLNQLKPLAGGNFTSFGNMLKKIGENDKAGVQKGAAQDKLSKVA